MRHKNTDADLQQIAAAVASAVRSLNALKTAPTQPVLPARVQANLQRAFRAQLAEGTQVNLVVSKTLAGAGHSNTPKSWRTGFSSHPSRWLIACAIAIAIAIAASATVFFINKDSEIAVKNGWESPKIGHLEAPFIALKELNLIALELNTTVVETQLSPMQLVRLGIAVNPNNTASTISAQVLMSDAGEALAFRID